MVYWQEHISYKKVLDLKYTEMCDYLQASAKGGKNIS